ncbi:MAG: hypothetical protein RSC93_02585 [Erysipelotrichaceae bacterium]
MKPTKNTLQKIERARSHSENLRRYKRLWKKWMNTCKSYMVMDSVLVIILIIIMGFMIGCSLLKETQQTYTFITMNSKEKTNGHYCDSNSMTCRVGNKVYQVKEFEANKQK